ncbi:hypothetical protein A1O1_08537 [Capronia coronata CBS 617.96]|uniref:DNA2/NAM7 helicase-like C-terminal domain-containing protein n=1 Tax=Capronia coronata CBS 617.96 TaxID=1182541 RepID=W9XJP1_9EURO|nr:uncharacterized protein A1O1_08537 [Capronia coronata CBS 617.96]EXJ80393.1 hypothetical protein A1O1_08537 [Capronia coronata CBS 617.96]
MAEQAIALRDAERERKVALLAASTKTSQTTPRVPSTSASTSSSPESSIILAYCRVPDERVQNLELSLGYRMLQMAGIKPGGPSLSPDLGAFHEWYDKYRAGEKFEPNDWDEFHTATDNLMAFTIKHAAAVCATAAGAADATFVKNYQAAEPVVVDEAARLPEYQHWPLLGLFPNVVGKILVGDPNQLHPMTESKGDSINPFERQVEMSLQERLQTLGFESAFFTTQYRAVPDIAAIYNNACYESRLTNDESTHVTARPLAQDIVSHNEQRYDRSTSVIFYNPPDPKEEYTFNGSKCCAQYATIVLKILEGLLLAGFGSDKPCSIAILTPYQGQERILRIAKAKMAEKYGVAANVILETAGKVQGIEYDIVIVDPVAVKSPGFLDKNRLNVLFSQAKSGLYVVGHYRSWIWMWKDDSLPLWTIAKELKKYQVDWPAGQTLASEFFDPSVLDD